METIVVLIILSPMFSGFQQGTKVERADARANFRHTDTTRTRPYGVNVPFMQRERHGWDIHIV
jgi:hypothetical protein